MNALEQIINTPLPAFRGNIRPLTRKEWAVNIRKLFKDLQLPPISVTTPSYSMASTVHIRIPSESCTDEEHTATHQAIDERERSSGAWLGYGHYCPYCKERWAAHQQTEKIILAAFPDLEDRSEYVSDYYDNCLSIS